MKYKDMYNEIKKKIVQKYVSLENPQFYFVTEALENGMWLEISEELKNKYIVEETTDINDDVSRSFEISYCNKKATLKLSFAGSYAIFFRYSHLTTKRIFMTKESEPTTVEEKSIFRLLMKYGLSMVKTEVLYKKVKLKLFKTSNVRVYHALFQDTDFISGEHNAKHRRNHYDFAGHKRK